MLTRAVVGCAFCNIAGVRALLTAVTVVGCKVSKGTVMNGSVVTSRVQLP